MTLDEASIIIGNIPINGDDDCYSITEYQWAKAMAIESLGLWDKIQTELKHKQLDIMVNPFKHDYEVMFENGRQSAFKEILNIINNKILEIENEINN